MTALAGSTAATSASLVAPARSGVVSMPTTRCTARDASARRRLASRRSDADRPGPDKREPPAQCGCKPCTQFERGPVMLATPERSEDAGSGSEIDGGACDERDVGGRPFQDRR